MMKEHVILGRDTGPVDTDTALPTDMRVLTPDMDAATVIEKYLASKHMSSMYLPQLWYSASRKRVLVNTGKCWHGRDLSGHSPMKWMNYNREQIVGVGGASGTVLVEDLFSYYKVQWALRKLRDLGVVCLLGTQPKTQLIDVVQSPALWMLDADLAGDTGFENGRRRLRPFVQEHHRVRPPEGLDPKDMCCADIYNAVIKEVT